MSLRINSNIAAMNAYRNLSVTDNAMSKSLEKLSSGFRINRAADDAAGLAISEGMRSQIGGLKQAVRNTQDGINVVQTADGALNESTAILQRMRDLSVQAANDGSLDGNAKTDIQTEMTQLNSELDRISNTTEFNGKKLLDGNYNGTFQVGSNAGETITVSGVGNMSAKGLSVDTIDVTTAAQAGYVSGLKVGDTIAATYGSTSTTAAFTDADAATLATKDGSSGFKVGATTVDLTGVSTAQGLVDKINNTAGVGAKAAIDSSGKLVITSKTAGTTGNAAAAVTTTQSPSPFASEVNGTDAKTATAADVTANDAKADGASKAITAITDAIKTVSTARANLGAYQNRFEHTVNNLNVAVENLSASESSIRDTDMAQEMTNFTKNQILQQAGTAMLAQANQAPQGVLKLLG